MMDMPFEQESLHDVLLVGRQRISPGPNGGHTRRPAAWGQPQSYEKQ